MFEPNFVISARSGHDDTTHAQTPTVISARSDVNGAGRLPLYSWVLGRCDSPVPTLSNPQMLYYSPLSVEDVRWNFEKILFDRAGQPFKRYESASEPFDLEEDIRLLIEQ